MDLTLMCTFLFGRNECIVLKTLCKNPRIEKYNKTALFDFYFFVLVNL